MERNKVIITLTLHGDLSHLLRKEQTAVLQYPLTRRASIKDIIESLGIPHTEIGAIHLNAFSATFNFIPEGGEHFHLYPFAHTTIQALPTELWPEKWKFQTFMVDVNALKVMRNLRMAGFDAVEIPMGTTTAQGKRAAQEQKVILSRNRDLLKCSSVIYGQLLRSEDHVEQLREVVARFGLAPHCKPFTRCITCNGTLQTIEKEQVLDRLEPLTRRYYTTFKICDTCQQIYWRGSHYAKMTSLLSKLQNLQIY